MQNDEKKWIDFTHVIEETMSVFPNDPSPTFQVVSTIEEGARMMQYSLLSHTGTHIDSSYHVVRNGKSLDQLPLSIFCGTAFVVPMGKTNGRSITKEDLLPYEEKFKDVDFLLVSTGQENKWKDPSYVDNYPVFDPELVFYLNKFCLKGLGMDTISPDPLDGLAFHQAWFAKEDRILIENICNLEAYQNQFLEIYVFPLSMKKEDGSPVRMVGYLK